jgi:hypothetical protein
MNNDFFRTDSKICCFNAPTAWPTDESWCYLLTGHFNMLRFALRTLKVRRQVFQTFPIFTQAEPSQISNCKVSLFPPYSLLHAQFLSVQLQHNKKSSVCRTLYKHFCARTTICLQLVHFNIHIIIFI